jgi:phosphoglucomutase
MMNNELLEKARKTAKTWLSQSFDEETREKVSYLLEHDEKELMECFHRNLDFGTGGLREIMGVGTNRMNKYTVGMATQGLCNYLLKQFPSEKVSVAIAYDNRNNSRYFAETSAGIFTANGIKVYLFDSLRPTPQLSFAIRHFKCKSGVVITASHNPKEYNGYKVYWEDGGQVINPHDKAIVDEVVRITDPSMVKFNRDNRLIEMLDSSFDNLYLKMVGSLSLSQDLVREYHDYKLVYTPIHGTGVHMVPAALRKFGFTNILNVPEQDITDGSFPTVHSPNPEEPAALKMALELAEKEQAELVMATDPDGDRIGVAVRNDQGHFILLNGNQTASLLIYYLLSKMHELKRLRGNEYVVKTIVTTELIPEIASAFRVDCLDVLTGFKYIAAIMKENEGKRTFVAGCEESYGFLAGDFVRDKDAVSACALIAESAVWAKSQGTSIYGLLKELSVKYGLYRESLLSITKKGIEGSQEISAMMDRFRNSPPDSLDGSDVVLVHDYEKQKSYDMISHLRHDIHMPKSNVLQYILQDGTKISIRPSGTEPKIKFYFGLREELQHQGSYEDVCQLLDERVERIKNAMGLTQL